MQGLLSIRAFVGIKKTLKWILDDIYGFYDPYFVSKPVS